MRSYGASIADMALLLVAADDGVTKRNNLCILSMYAECILEYVYFCYLQVCLQTKESMGILEELGK